MVVVFFIVVVPAMVSQALGLLLYRRLSDGYCAAGSRTVAVSQALWRGCLLEHCYHSLYAADEGVDFLFCVI